MNGDNFEDYYEILGVPFTASKKEISKAFRAKAPLLHPDKHKGDPSAVKKFVLLGKAKDILTDDKAREAYDLLVKARRTQIEQESKLDAERRRMIRELNEREQRSKAKTAKELERDAQAQLAAEIERLKKEGILKDYTTTDSLSDAIDAASGPDGTLKFSFSKGEKRWKDRDSVKSFMSSWGIVTGVVCKKSSGVVSFSKMNFDAESALSLMTEAAEKAGTPLSVKWLKKPSFEQPQQEPQVKRGHDDADDLGDIDSLERDIFKMMAQSKNNNNNENMKEGSEEPETKRMKK